jgi:hypothetical protein
MVDWNGTVVPCCFDKDEDYPMGNALKQDFAEIWHSPMYDDFRRELITKGRVKEMCRNCTEGLKSYYIPLDKLERFAEDPAVDRDPESVAKTHRIQDDILDAAGDVRVVGFDETPVQIGGTSDADARR